MESPTPKELAASTAEALTILEHLQIFPHLNGQKKSPTPRWIKPGQRELPTGKWNYGKEM
jgi:hypothetical protein